MKTLAAVFLAVVVGFVLLPVLLLALVAGWAVIEATT